MPLELLDITSIITFCLVFVSLMSMIHLARVFVIPTPHHFDLDANMFTDVGDHTGELAKLHPNPIWVTDNKGNVLWKNDACFEDLEPLFQVVTAWIGAGQTHGRSSTTTVDKKRLWYDLKSIPNADTFVWFATPADAEIEAEETRREFVQTLAKTFAQLSTGLAIFDSSRNLALFNPALLELTGLPFETLSQRPSLATFLDTLRSKGLLPEPRDYTDWRNKISTLETQAEEGSYSDVWELPDGVTYRVTGKPHPGGAIAFLIEDISVEISRSRAVRKELDLFHGIFNAASPMSVVFDDTGQIVMSNDAFDAGWGPFGFDEGRTTSVVSCMPIWQRATFPNPAWCDLRDFVVQPGERAQWSTTLSRRSGDEMTMHCTPLPNRQTLVEFIHETVEPEQFLQARA